MDQPCYIAAYNPQVNKRRVNTKTKARFMWYKLSYNPFFYPNDQTNEIFHQHLWYLQACVDLGIVLGCTLGVQLGGPLGNVLGSGCTIGAWLGGPCYGGLYAGNVAWFGMGLGMMQDFAHNGPSTPIIGWIIFLCAVERNIEVTIVLDLSFTCHEQRSWLNELALWNWMRNKQALWVQVPSQLQKHTYHGAHACHRGNIPAINQLVEWGCALKVNDNQTSTVSASTLPIHGAHSLCCTDIPFTNLLVEWCCLRKLNDNQTGTVSHGTIQTTKEHVLWAACLSQRKNCNHKLVGWRHLQKKTEWHTEKHC
jgi:hypothetical protein